MGVVELGHFIHLLCFLFSVSQPLFAQATLFPFKFGFPFSSFHVETIFFSPSWFEVSLSRGIYCVLQNQGKKCRVVQW